MRESREPWTRGCSAIDFYKLTRPVQERFIGSVNGSGLPAPILRTNAAPRASARLARRDAPSRSYRDARLPLRFRRPREQRRSPGPFHGSARTSRSSRSPSSASLRATAIFASTRRARSGAASTSSLSDSFDARQPGPPPLSDRRSRERRRPGGRATFTLDFGAAVVRLPREGRRARRERRRRALASARGKSTKRRRRAREHPPEGARGARPSPRLRQPARSRRSRMCRRTPTWVKLGWAIALGVGRDRRRVALGGPQREKRRCDVRASGRGERRRRLPGLPRRGIAPRSRESDDPAPRAELLAAEKVGTVAAIEGYVKDHRKRTSARRVAAALKAALEQGARRRA